MTTTMKTLQLDAEERATVLAALRMWQSRYEDVDADTIRAIWPMHFQDVAPLGTEDIDSLCEKLNAA